MTHRELRRPPAEWATSLGDSYAALARTRELTPTEQGAYRVSRLLALNISGLSRSSAIKNVREMMQVLAWNDDERSQGARDVCARLLQQMGDTPG